MDREQVHDRWQQRATTADGQWVKSPGESVDARNHARGRPDRGGRDLEMGRNDLLACLSSPDRERAGRYGDIVPLVAGQLLNDSVHAGRYVYFPTSGSISLVLELADGVTLEVASVGRNGMTGLAEFGCSERQVSRALVKTAGAAYRVKIGVWQREFAQHESLQQAMSSYHQSLMSQLIQLAACNRLHTLQERFARWLLTTFDHACPSDELQLTHEFVATLLGVRREGITSAAINLQLAGAIRYARGRITLSDRAALVASACECYEVIKPDDDGGSLTHPRPGRPVLPAAHLAR